MHRREIEVTGQDGSARNFGPALLKQEGLAGGAVPGGTDTLGVQNRLHQHADLRQPLLRADMAEMDAVDAERSRRRIDCRLDEAALQVELVDELRLGQKMAARPGDRPTRDHGIAEAATAIDDPPLRIDHARVGLHRAVIPMVAIEPAGDFSGLVGEGILRPTGDGLLDADDIGLGRCVSDAGHVVLAVGADAVVDVVGTEEQYRL